MKILCVLLVAVGGLWPVGVVTGETLSAEEVLEFATAQQERCESFTAEIEQSIQILGSRVSLKGQLEFQKPARMRMQLHLPIMGQETTTTVVMGDDRVLWQQMDLPGQVQVMKMDFNSLPADAPVKDPTRDVDPRRQLARAREIYTHERLPDRELHGQKMYVLAGTVRPDARLVPSEAAFLKNLGRSLMYIGQEDGFTHRVEQYDVTGTNLVLQVDFRNVQRNVTIAEDRFRYVPPPAATVVDVSVLLRQAPALPPGFDGPRRD